MSLLLNLPNALFAELLTRWIDTVPIGKLDSAFCNKAQRCEFLHSLDSDSIVLTEQIPLHWTLNRNVRVSNIVITTGTVFPDDIIAAFVARSGKYVKSMHLLRKDIPLELLNFQAFSNLERLELSNSKMETTIRSALSSCSRLHTLELLNVGSKFSGVRLSKQYCPSLTTLRINNAMQDTVLEAISTACPNLTSLTCQGGQLTDAPFSTVAKNCPKLVALKLEH